MTGTDKNLSDLFLLSSSSESIQLPGSGKGASLGLGSNLAAYSIYHAQLLGAVF